MSGWNQLLFEELLPYAYLYSMYMTKLRWMRYITEPGV